MFGWQQHRLPRRLAPTFEAHVRSGRTWRGDTIAQLIGPPYDSLSYTHPPSTFPPVYMRILNWPGMCYLFCSSESHDNANCSRGNVHVLQPCSSPVQYGHVSAVNRVTWKTQRSLNRPLYIITFGSNDFWDPRQLRINWGFDSNFVQRVGQSCAGGCTFWAFVCMSYFTRKPQDIAYFSNHITWNGVKAGLN